MKQKILIACVAVLAVVAIVFGSLYFSNNAEKTLAIETLNDEKVKLTDDVAGKNDQIESLKGEKEQLAAEHSAVIEQKDAEIAALTGEKEALTAEKEQLALDYAAAVEQKDGEIAALTADKEALTAEKEQLVLDYAAAVEQKDGEIATLTAEKEQLVLDHAAAMEEKDGEIAVLTAEKEALVAEKEKLTTDYEAAIAEKDNTIAQLQGQLDAPAVPETKADTIEEAIVGDWVMSWDSEGIAAVLNADPDQVEDFRAMGVEVMMSFDGKGISTLSVWVLGQRLEDSVANASYEIMGDQIRTGSKTHGLQIEGDTMTLVTDKGTVILNRK